jgi:outer membrane biosynthesis protein TonB
VERQQSRRDRCAAQAAGRRSFAEELIAMRTVNPPQSQFAHLRTALMLHAFGLVLLGAPLWLSAQAPTDQTPTPGATPKPVHIHKRPSPAHPESVTQASELQAHMVAPKPEKPKWPAFDQPVQASVVWDSRGLSIEASNSSLQQILRDVSTATGVKIDGVTSDQRVFGAYGPGQARDVLSQLLQGSGYNVIMVGDRGEGTPRQILLSTRQSTTSATAARPYQANNNNEEDEADEPPPPPEQPEQPVRPAFPPGAPPRSPQQIMQEMQQRQQQIQQNQQQQPNQPQPQ